MGFHKFLDLHLIPSCFNLVGNLHDSGVPSEVRLAAESPTPEATINLVTLGGHVKTYHRPIPVAELMAEFPKHLVCRSDAFYIGQQIPALSEHDSLDPGQNYFLLPDHFFQSVLTFVTVASFVALRSIGGGKTARCRPFDVITTTSGCVRIHMSDEFISELVEDGKWSREGQKGRGTTRLCSTPQLEKDYARLVKGLKSGQWKPKLETITESRKESKRRKNQDIHFTKLSSLVVASSSPSKTFCRIVNCHR